MTEAELKARLMAAMEGEVDGLVKWEMGTKQVTFTKIEDEVLARREEMGRRMAESVQAHREGMRGAAIARVFLRHGSANGPVCVR